MDSIINEELSLFYNNPEWPISIHDFTGKYIPPSHAKKINFFDIIVHCKRKYVCDSNSSWKAQASNQQNRSKYFILSNPTLDEQKDFYNNIFSDNIDLSHGNIFIVLILPNQCGVAIERYTNELKKVRKDDQLKLVSQERQKEANAMAADVRKMEEDFMKTVAVDKQNILKLLNGLDLSQVGQNQIAALEEAKQLKVSLLDTIQKYKFDCFKNYFLCNDIVYMCYAALLLEPDSVGVKTRKEFSEQKRNTFGDTIIFRDALWLNANILSNDNAIKRMAEYIGLPKVKVVGMV